MVSRVLGGVLSTCFLFAAACSFDTSGLIPRSDAPGRDTGPSELSADVPLSETMDLAEDSLLPGETSVDQRPIDLPQPACTASTCTGKTPICDGICRPCWAHSECAAGLCRADGSCPPESAISYVDDDCTGSRDGTSKKPFCKIIDALEDSASLILVRPGTYGDVTITSDVEIYGRPGAILKPSACDKLVVDGKHQVLLSGFTIQGNVVIKGGATATLLQDKIGPSACIGVNATGSELVLERSLVFSHTGGGVLLDGKYSVRNSILVKNGDSGLNWGAVKIMSADPASIFMNNTIADNVAKGSNDKEAAGIRCEAPAAAVVFLNTIFWGNTFNNHSNASDDRQYGPGCVAKYSLEELKSGGSPAAGSNNISLAPDFVANGAEDAAYHLKPSSPAKDKGTSTGAPSVDYDGQFRNDGSPDIGADELP